MQQVRLVGSILIVALCLILAPGSSWSQEVITVGGCQPITGRFAFAGLHINEGLMGALGYANEKGCWAANSSSTSTRIPATISCAPWPPSSR
jgi:hypothetical protein